MADKDPAEELAKWRDLADERGKLNQSLNGQLQGSKRTIAALERQLDAAKNASGQQIVLNGPDTDEWQAKLTAAQSEATSLRVELAEAKELIYEMARRVVRTN